MPQVIHVADRTYRVLSLSKPGLYRYTDLDKASCTCPATTPDCRHRKLARQYEATEGVEYSIERCHDSRIGGYVYRVFEVRVHPERGDERHAISERPNFYDALLDREELYAGCADSGVA